MTDHSAMSRSRFSPSRDLTSLTREARVARKRYLAGMVLEQIGWDLRYPVSIDAETLRFISGTRRNGEEQSRNE